MANRKKLNYLNFGPPIKIVPVTSFSRLPREVVEAAWEIIGPTVERNWDKIPMWQLFATCYAQGAENAVECMKEQLSPKSGEQLQLL